MANSKHVHIRYNIWFDSIIKKELVQQLLSYGQDLKVLAPESLKMQMRKHVESMKKYYRIQ